MALLDVHRLPMNLQHSKWISLVVQSDLFVQTAQLEKKRKKQDTRAKLLIFFFFFFFYL